LEEAPEPVREGRASTVAVAPETNLVAVAVALETNLVALAVALETNFVAVAESFEKKIGPGAATEVGCWGTLMTGSVV
jgi:hypothetical protein